MDRKVYVLTLVLLLTIAFGMVGKGEGACGGDWQQPGSQCTFPCRIGEVIMVSGVALRDEPNPEVRISVTAVCGGIGITCFAGGLMEASCQFTSDPRFPVDQADEKGECTVQGVSFGSFLCRSVLPSEYVSGQTACNSSRPLAIDSTGSTSTWAGGR